MSRSQTSISFPSSRAHYDVRPDSAPLVLQTRERALTTASASSSTGRPTASSSSPTRYVHCSVDPPLPPNLQQHSPQSLLSITSYTRNVSLGTCMWCFAVQTFRGHIKTFPKGCDNCCDLLICDEAHRLKNAETATNQTLAGTLTVPLLPISSWLRMASQVDCHCLRTTHVCCPPL